MRHLDEGILSALYDGELAGPEQREAEGHLQRCEDCRRRYEELRELAGEADRLLPALDEGLEPAPRRRNRIGRYRVVAWAATIVITLGLGLTMRALLYQPAAIATNADPGAGLETGAARQGPDAPVLPPGETPDARPGEPGAEPQRSGLVSSGETTAPPAAALEAAREASGVAARDEERSQAPEPQPGVARNENELRQEEETPKLAAKGFTESDVRSDAASGAAAEPPRARPVAPAPTQFVAARPVALDSAAILLGRRVRQIEGLTPEAVEITAAEPGTRGPLVRIRYRVQGEEVVLDQWVPVESRALAPGSARGRLELRDQSRNSLQWNSLDGVTLVLYGSLPSQALDQLRARVR